MPQKRNPDAAELIRAKAARIGADFAALNGLVQKLPLAYAKDLQEDKALTFSAFDDFSLSLTAMIGMIETMRFNREAMREAAARGYSTATDLADWLVRDLKMPFREAHEVTGKIVRRAEDAGVADLAQLPLGDFQVVEPRITEAARALLTVEKSVERAGIAMAEPLAARVREQIERWKEMKRMKRLGPRYGCADADHRLRHPGRPRNAPTRLEPRRSHPSGNANAGPKTTNGKIRAVRNTKPASIRSCRHSGAMREH
ncbi:MAG: hypothetical protein R3C16_12350 [Hyphomonadaceae bacterium]